MKNQGKIFEQDFRDSIPADAYYKKLQDAAIGFNVAESTQRFAPKSPYDYILFRKPNLFCLELKSTEGTSFSFDGSSPMIKKHQREELLKAHQGGAIAGLVLNFRKAEQTWFVPIIEFERFVENTEKKSINLKDIETLFHVAEFKPMLIGQEKKKVHYHYDVDGFIKRFEEGSD